MAIAWTLALKRTSDPKLGYIEHLLTERGIPHKRDGYSFHGPCLYVPESHEEAVDALLRTPARTLGLPVRHGVSLDDVPDDHRSFIADDFNPRKYDYDSCWAIYTPTDFIPTCANTNPCGECQECVDAIEDENDVVGMGWVGRDGRP